MSADAGSQAGFGLVEVMAALALTSIALVAAGGLIQLAAGSMRSIAEAEAVHRALLDVDGVSRVLSQRAGLAIADVEEGAVRLSFSETDGTEAVIALEDSSILTLARQQRIARADLAVFETKALEHLAAEASGAAWTTEPGDRRVVAVRLRLGLGNRVWRPLLWMAPQEAAQ